MSTFKTNLPPSRANLRYLEFDLDDDTMSAVEQLAGEEGVSPFEMCVTLLRERVASAFETDS